MDWTRHRLQGDREHNWLPVLCSAPAVRHKRPEGWKRLSMIPRRSLTAHCREGKLQNGSPIGMGMIMIIFYRDHRTYDDLWPTEMHTKLIILWTYHKDSVLLAWLKKYERLSVLSYQFEFIQIMRVITIGIACGFQRWFPGCSFGLWKEAIQRYWSLKMEHWALQMTGG